ncbi:Peptidoglycan/xylan/chitin deacetylase, PgdA/CDA1 family [Alteromonadaceae bacterium Bs31]|nr:Peptidoglycan/xylan/chitin deacetylase, PgdA/CDA1 family [Alteromonadaceae bacterium Bs31]
MIIKLSLITLLFCLSLTGQAASLPWDGKAAAVSLSYDDALNVHIDKVAPALEKRKMRGTFYINGNSEGFKNRIEDWRKVAAKGHELGNHTLFHPCMGGAGREWLNAEWDLNTWTVKRLNDNILINNALLQAVDGQTERSFAYTCGDTLAGGQAFYPLIQQHFVAARGVSGGYARLEEVDLNKLRAFTIVKQNADELIQQVDQAIKEKAWLVFLFHGVGGEHDMNIAQEEHDKLLDYLKKRRKAVWLAPVREIGGFVSEYQEKK